MADDQEYARRLGQVLRQRDVAALRAFLEEQAARYGDERQVEAIRQQSDAELEAILHRMILSRPDLADLHAESERQLDTGGSTGARPPRASRRRPSGPGKPGPRQAPPGHRGPGPRRHGPGRPGDGRSPDGRAT